MPSTPKLSHSWRLDDSLYHPGSRWPPIDGTRSRTCSTGRGRERLRIVPHSSPPRAATTRGCVEKVETLLEQTAATTELPSRQIGYPIEILSLLGAGGMGAVYLADDTRLRRKVALKVLHPASAGEDTNRRLLHEARAAAALDHPNICAIFEAGEADGHSFIAMQFVEGETLASRLTRGPLPSRRSHCHCGRSRRRPCRGAPARRRPSRHQAAEHRDLHDAATPRCSTSALPSAWPSIGESGSDCHRRSHRLGGGDPGLHVARAGTRRGARRTNRCLQLRDRLVRDVHGASSVRAVNPGGHAGRDHRGSAAHRSDPRFPQPGARANRSQMSRPGQDAAGHQSALELLTDLRRLNQTQTQDVAAGVRRSRRFLILAGGGVALALMVAGTELYRRSASTRSDVSIGRRPPVRQRRSWFGLRLSGGRDHGQHHHPIIAGAGSSGDLARRCLQLSGARRRSPHRRERAGRRGVGDRPCASQRRFGHHQRRDRGRARQLPFLGEQYRRRPTELVVAQDEIPRAVSDRLRPAFKTADHAAVNVRTGSEAYQQYLQGRFFWHLWTQDGARRAVDLFQKAIDLDANYALAYAGLAEAHIYRGPPPAARVVCTCARGGDEGARARPDAQRSACVSGLRAAGGGLGFRRGRARIPTGPGARPEQHRGPSSVPRITCSRSAALSRQRSRSSASWSSIPFRSCRSPTSDTTLGTRGSMTKPFDIMRATRLPTRKNRIPTGRWATSTLSRGCQRRRLRAYLRFHSLNGASPTELDALKRAFASEGLRGY